MPMVTAEPVDARRNFDLVDVPGSAFDLEKNLREEFDDFPWPSPVQGEFPAGGPGLWGEQPNEVTGLKWPSILLSSV